MKPTKQFFERMISVCEREKEWCRESFDYISFERQSAVEKFCRYLIEKGIFVEEGEKETADGLEHKAPAGR